MKTFIDLAIKRAQDRGYRISDRNFVDSRVKTCCPMGAVMMFSRQLPTNNFMASFAIGFDLTSPSKMKDIDTDAYELGKYYKRKILTNQI